jgi:transcriptional regulator with XRE-family HTH domain
MAKKAHPPTEDVEGISRELRRFQLLVRLLGTYAGINRAEMARRTGIDESHISKLCNTEKYGYTGLSTDIVRKVRDGIKISTEFIFDPELKPVPEADLLKVYSLDEQREKKWRQAVDEQLRGLATWKVDQTAKTLELQAELTRKDHEINRLKLELAQALNNGSAPKRRPPK